MFFVLRVLIKFIDVLLRILFWYHLSIPWYYCQNLQIKRSASTKARTQFAGAGGLQQRRKKKLYHWRQSFMKHVKNHVDNEIPTVSKESDDRLGKRVEDGFAWTQARPGACIIKLITAVIYGFRSKLECLSLNTNKAGKACQVQTLQLIAVTVNYDRNKFYDTGPRGQCYKTFYGPKL